MFVAFYTEADIIGGMDEPCVIDSFADKNKYKCLDWMKGKFAEAVKDSSLVYAKFDNESMTAKVAYEQTVIVIGVKKTKVCGEED